MLFRSYEEESDRTLLDVLSGAKVINPEDMVIGKEEFGDVEREMNRILSDLERQVLRSYLDGKSYQEMSEELHRHVKSIDNALQRVKRKLEKFMQSQGDVADLRNIYNGLIAMNPEDRFSLAKKEKK